MLSLKLAVCVCLLFTMGIEGAPEPKPCPPYLCPPYYNRGGGLGRRTAPWIYYNRGGDRASYPYYSNRGGDSASYPYYSNRGAEPNDPRCPGSAKHYCCNWGNGIDCGCYC